MLCDSYISPMRFMHTYNLCDSCMGAMRLMHNRLFLSGMTDSPMRLSDSLSSVNQIHESSEKYLRIVVFKPHYTKYLVNLYFRTIDLYFGIANLPFRIDSVKFGYTNGILGSHPHQWKYETPTVEIRVDPTSGNMVVIR
jgi:hypothetical protein